MFKKMLAVGCAVACMVFLAGCDLGTVGKGAPEATKMLMEMHGVHAGDGLMDQLRIQDRLHDGTGENCPGECGTGTCDGTGPHGPGGNGGGD